MGNGTPMKAASDPPFSVFSGRALLNLAKPLSDHQCPESSEITMASVLPPPVAWAVSDEKQGEAGAVFSADLTFDRFGCPGQMDR